MVQDEPGAREAPQVVDWVVPVGRPGVVVMLTDSAGSCPVFITVKIREVPLVFRANVGVLKDKDVVPGGLSEQLMEIELTFAVMLVPAAFDIVQV